MNTVLVPKDELVSKLSSIKEDAVSIAGIAIKKQMLLQLLKLQTQQGSDVLKINYGNVTWHYEYDMVRKESEHYNNYDWENHKFDVDNNCEWVHKPEDIDKGDAVQITCDHTTMRFLNNTSFMPYQIVPLELLAYNAIRESPIGIPLDSQELLKALTYVLPCVASEESRPILNCVLFDCKQGEITLVTADGFKLGMSKLKAEGVADGLILISEPLGLLTFLKALKPTGKGKSKEYPQIYFAVTDKTVKFQTYTNTLEVARFDGVFPDYKQLIPEGGTKVEFIADDVLQATRNMGSVAKDSSGIVRLIFTAGNPVGNLHFSAHSEEIGELTAECDSRVAADCKIGFDFKYLKQLMLVSKGMMVTGYITSPSSPGKFETQQGSWLIMPMFVQW